MIVNLYKLYIFFSHFSSQPNKIVFIILLFHPHPKLWEKTINSFYSQSFSSPHHFLSSHPPTKWTLGARALSLSLSLSLITGSQDMRTFQQKKDSKPNETSSTTEAIGQWGFKVEQEIGLILTERTRVIGLIFGISCNVLDQQG